MQVKRGPTIPKKPHYLSNFDPEFNKNTADTNKESATNRHGSPRRTEFTSTQTPAPTILRDKQTQNPNGRKMDTNTPHKPPRRRRPTLTIQHLTLYSSSSPVNLLANSNSSTISTNDSNRTTASVNSFPASTNFGRQRASSSLQQSSQVHSRNSSEGPPTKPRRPSAPQMPSPGGYFKPSHSSQWNFDLFEQQQQNIAKDKTENAKTTSTGVSNSMGNFDSQPSIHSSSIPSVSSLSSEYYSRPAPPPPTNSNNKYDGIIAQLVEMGFDAKDAESAAKSSKGFTIQSCLDILVRKGSSSTTGNLHQKPQYATFGSSASASNQQRPVSPSTTMNSMQANRSSSFGIGKHRRPHESSFGETDDISSSSDDDDALSNDQEWQRQQEIRRRDYLESMKKEQQRQEQLRREQQQEQLRKEQQQEQLRREQQQEQLRKEQQQEQLRREQQQQQLRKEQQQEQHRREQQQQHQQQQQQKHNQSTFDRASTTSPYTKATTSEPPFAPRPPQYPRTSTSTSSRTSTSTSFDSSPTTKPITADLIKKAVKARTRGNDLFKLGYYAEAEKSYNQALAILPDQHDITAVVTNNRAAARLKNGLYQSCVTDCSFVIEWTRQKSTSECQTMAVLDGDITVRWHDQLGKALHRKAEALEKMARLVDAQHIYEELIKMDGGDTKARKGLERCQPPPPTKPPPPPRRTPAATNKPATPARPQQSDSAFPGLDYSIFEINNRINEPPPSKAVAAMRARQAEIAKEESERMEKADMVNARIDRWKKGKEKNLRALLSSLDTLLWPGAQWRGAPINELLEPKKVKVCYMKAIAKVHPDKLPSSTTVEQKLLASGIFSVLNQAWDDFRTTNRI